MVEGPRLRRTIIRSLTRSLAVSVLVMLFVTTWGVPRVVLAGFSDVSGHWAAQAIQWASEKGIVNGYPDGTFKPDRFVTREEALKMVAMAFPKVFRGDYQRSFNPDYPDIYGRWSTAYVKPLLPLVRGYSDFTFRPADYMNRLDIMSLLLKSRLLQEDLVGNDPTSAFVWMPSPSDEAVSAIGELPETKAITLGDSREDEIALWRPMAVLVSSGLVRGYTDGTYGWGRYVTRAELCTLIMRTIHWKVPEYGRFESLALTQGSVPHPSADEENAQRRIAEAGSFYLSSYKDEYSRARVIYDTISVNFRYDNEGLASGKPVPGTPQKVVALGKGICEGIAMLYQSLAKAAGLNAEVVTGYAVNPGMSGPHAWIRVNLSNRQVYCDPTWGMSGQSFFDNLDYYRKLGNFSWQEW